MEQYWIRKIGNWFLLHFILCTVSLTYGISKDTSVVLQMIKAPTTFVYASGSRMTPILLKRVEALLQEENEHSVQLSWFLLLLLFFFGSVDINIFLFGQRKATTRVSKCLKIILHTSKKKASQKLSCHSIFFCQKNEPKL
ncbi:hypothetical protein BD560DRAFT_170086 [Blakeslea trispora]|nr:hypothetical protein BD560DRAFT_170086 [Blakeslea trispora]